MIQHEVPFPALTCRIVSKKSRKVLALSSCNETSGVLILKDRKGQERELFRLIDKGKYFLIQSIFNNHFLSVYQSSINGGTGLISLESFNVESQHFYLKSTGNHGQFYIHTFCHLALDCCGEDDTDGTQIIQWQQSGKDHQKWLIQYI